MRGSFARFVAIALACLPAFASVPELPRAYLDTAYAAPAGTTINVPAGGDLQAAIDLASPGDTIVLQARGIYNGPITLRNKGASTRWIYVTTSAYASLPAPGNRVSPQDASNMAIIVGTGQPVVALQTAGAAHHYRFVGIEFRPAAGTFATALIRFGDGTERSTPEFANNLVIDRCYVHGDATIGGRRGLALNSASSAVVDSYFSDWKEAGADSQAIAGWSGPGPYRIVNNYLEGAAENLLFGGADPAIAGLSPSDIEIRGNRLAKPVAWRSQGWTVKNLFELKNARRVLVEGNVFEYTWLAGQDFAINIKSSNQSGTAPWSVTSDLTFRHNVVAHAPNAIKLCGLSCDGEATPQGRAYLLQNNLFFDIDSAAWGGLGNFLQTITPVPGLVVSHNTVIHDGSPYSGGDGGEAANSGFQFTDNIVQRGPAGFKGTGAGEGSGTLARYFPGAVFTGNAIVGGSLAAYPAGNQFPVTYAALGFANAASGDYRLGASSSYRNAAADSLDTGADLDAVRSATACATSGQCAGVRFSPPAVAAFAFTDQSNVVPGALVTSNAITVSGTDLPATISIAGGGAYAIGCGTRTATHVGLVRPGQSVCIRYRAPLSPGAITETTLTINGVSATFRTTTATVSAAAAAELPNHTGLWWNPAESGWGVTFAHQGDTMFATLFTYDAQRRPLWLVMPAGKAQAIAIDDFGAGLADLGTFAGVLYRTTGPPFNAQPSPPIDTDDVTPVGEMHATFGTNAATLDYTVNGSHVVKSIRRQLFGARETTCRGTVAARAGATNFQDLWWNPAEAGWGLGIAHQGDTIFATLFTYGADGQVLWLVMSGGARQADGSYLGDLYRTAGPVFDAQPFTPVAAADVRRVGSMRLRFADGESATLEYSVDGVSVTRALTRQVFGTPAPLCTS